MKKILVIVIGLCCAILSGCEFHMRSAASFPSELHTLYFSTDKPYSALSIQLKELLHSMQVHITNKQSNARFSLIISNDTFSYSRPEIVDTTLPTSITFVHSVTVSIRDNTSNTIITSESFSASQILVLNVNQIYTANANELVKQQLNRRIASLIYYWLRSINTKTALKHANNANSTQHEH